MNERVRVGIVGFDHPHVLRFAPMLASNVDVSLAWIAADGPNRRAAQEMAERVGCAFLDEPRADVDAAYLADRPGQHLASVRRLAPQGIHILCDKPIALTAEDGRAIVDEARRAGIRLMVPFNPRGQVGPRAIKRRIDAGELGEIRLLHAVKTGRVPLGIPGIDCSWLVDPAEAGFGGFGDIGIHAVDALCWLMGRPPVRVFATIHRGARPDLEIDSIGTAMFEWDDGAIATLTAGWINPAASLSSLEARFEVVGTRAAALVESPYQEYRLADEDRAERVAFLRPDAAWIIESFIDAVRRDAEPPMTGEAGLRALEIVLACYRSSERGEAVAL